MSEGHGHGHGHGHDGDDAAIFTAAYWDDRYAGSPRLWSGRPNAQLVEHAAALAPGTALDVGCGEGADVVWLAGRGWRATGVDVSAIALERARTHAADADVSDLTTFQRVDLISGDPPLPSETFDLVTAQFIHMPDEAFDAAYAGIAATVSVGGTLIITGHHPAEAGTGLRNEELSHLLFTPERVVSTLDADAVEIVVADAVPRAATTPDGDETTATDTVVVARRLG